MAPDRIRVLVVSDADGRNCGKTLHSLYSSASIPSRLRVSVTDITLTVPHNSPRDSCLSNFCSSLGKKGGGDAAACRFPASDHPVSFVDLDQAFSRGMPMGIALSASQSLSPDDDFCLLVSSAADFEKSWDTSLLSMWRELDSEYAVLSTAPPPRSKAPSGTISRQCRIGWPHTTNGVPEVAAPTFVSFASASPPPLSLLWSNSFSFSKCHSLTSVPPDPFLEQVPAPIFNFAHLARLWTSGYDVYEPSASVVFSRDGAAPNAESLSDYKKRRQDQALRRVSDLLKLGSGDSYRPFPSSPYGLGTSRSLTAFFEFLKVDVKSRQQSMCEGNDSAGACCPALSARPTPLDKAPRPLSPPSFYLDEPTPSYAILQAAASQPALFNPSISSISEKRYFFSPSAGVPFLDAAQPDDVVGAAAARRRVLAAAGAVQVLLVVVWVALFIGRRTSIKRQGMTEKHRAIMNPLGDAMKLV